MARFWSKEAALWGFALYGTAVGAGTLFLPIQLGSAGTIVLFITALVAWPLTYWPHKALSQFILAAPASGAAEGITHAVKYYYGKRVGNLITFLYFIAFFVIVLIYAVAITNSLIEQIATHYPLTHLARVGLSFLVVMVLNLIFLMGRQTTLRVMGFLVFPILAYFFFLSCYMVKDWHPERLALTGQFSTSSFHQLWLSLPVMVFAFSHTPIISTFSVAQRETHGDAAISNVQRIMRWAYLVISLSVLFFVFSCYLSIPTANIQEAKDKGLTVLSALSMKPDSPAWLALSGIIVAIVAMSKSFLGTYFGVIEGATELTRSVLKPFGVSRSYRFNRTVSVCVVSLITFGVCSVNPNALSMIYAISGPLIAMILFIMPTLSTWLIAELKPYRSLGNLLTLVVGMLCVSVMFFH
ncbi:amino acid permease [Rosenbergiella australiborealis]|uniref:amino acid permease n=1 Tax=Rosenbergiella australiborealis TaxID=1544696 RepID=UPI001F4EDF8C|nr:amino acid permease [Rosenbergiella australiborealis]